MTGERISKPGGLFGSFGGADLANSVFSGEARHASFQRIKSQGWRVFGWDLQSSHAYGGVVSDPVEGAQHYERRLLVLRNAAGAQLAQWWHE